MGRFVNTFAGDYIAAEDVGIDTQFIDWMSTETDHAMGGETVSTGGDPSPFTAKGTFNGMKACLRFQGKDPDFHGLRVAVQDRDFSSSLEPGYQVTCSIGVATIGRNEGIPGWFERADRALYAAKAGGRNQVRMAMPPLDSGADTNDRVPADPVLRAEFEQMCASGSRRKGPGRKK